MAALSLVLFKPSLKWLGILSTAEAKEKLSKYVSQK